MSTTLNTKVMLQDDRGFDVLNVAVVENGSERLLLPGAHHRYSDIVFWSPNRTRYMYLDNFGDHGQFQNPLIPNS